MTDYFASKEDNTIVVLHNGGAQRGHTVITPEGYRHVFRHFANEVHNMGCNVDELLKFFNITR